VVRFRDVFSTTSSSVIPSVSPSIMRRRMPGTAYCRIPSSVWVTIETPMLRSSRLELTGPTGQRGTLQNVSGVMPDRDPSILFPRFRHGLVMIRLITLSWLNSARSTLPSFRRARQRVGCRLVGLLGSPASPGLLDSPASLGLLDSVVRRAGWSAILPRRVARRAGWSSELVGNTASPVC
jgi:hypothetical protein